MVTTILIGMIFLFVSYRLFDDVDDCSNEWCAVLCFISGILIGSFGIACALMPLCSLYEGCIK